MKRSDTALLIVFLAVCAIAVVYLSPFIARAQNAFSGSSTKQTAPAAAGTVTADSSVLGAPSLSPDYINNVLCSASSPACGTGPDLYTYGKQYGIDPAWALAWFQHESDYGTEGIARETHSLGNIRCSAGYSCIGGFRAYTSWQDGYADWYKLIAWYVNNLHKSSVHDILYTYAPPSENSTDTYIDAVCSAVNAWRQEVTV